MKINWKVRLRNKTWLASVLALIVSMFAALAMSVSAASYTYNSGKRGAVCTSLSSKAKAYYTGSYTYASLSAKSGSSLRILSYILKCSFHGACVAVR